MTIKTFTCDACNRSVTEEHDDELALAQFQRDYPERAKLMLADPDWRDHFKIVCQSCYDIIKRHVGEEKGATLQ